LLRWLFLIMISCVVNAPRTLAHEIRPAFLELRQTATDTFDILWKVPALGDLRLGLYVRLPDGIENITDPHGMFTGGAYVARWRIRHPDRLVGSTIHIDGLKTTLTDVLVRIERLDGTTQVSRLTPTNTSLVVQASPSPWQVAWTYLILGVEHILLGVDHLLFVLALLILVKGYKQIVATITAFTIAHSFTLAAATLGFVLVPGPPVEAIIALSIVFVAAEIIRGRQGNPGLTARWPWIVSFIFGLLHGFGFAGALSEVGLPQTSIPLALFTFNLGVEAGQLIFVTAALALYAIVRRIPVSPPEWVCQIPAYAIGSIAVFWMIERTAGF